MFKRWQWLAVGVLALAAAPVNAGLRELSTVESAIGVLKTLTADPHKGLPPALMIRDADAKRGRSSNRANHLI